MPAVYAPSFCDCIHRWHVHCRDCELTFTGMNAYDHHRRGGKCLPPQRIGLRLRWIEGRSRSLGAAGTAAWGMPQGGPTGFRGGNGQGFQPGNRHQLAAGAPGTERSANRTSFKPGNQAARKHPRKDTSR